VGLCLGATIGVSKALVPRRIKGNIDDTEFIHRKDARSQSGLHVFCNEVMDILLGSAPSKRNQRTLGQACPQVRVQVLLRCLRVKVWSLEFVGGDQKPGRALSRSFDVTRI
jgi:hypothetical protein